MRKSAGMSLVELILVLAIIGSLFVMGYALYTQNRSQKDFAQLKYNVDTLIQGLRGYYQTNCQTGTLSPTNPAYNASQVSQLLSNAFAVNIPVMLEGMLPLNWPQANVYVDDSWGTHGYSAQYNPTVSTKQAYACWNLTGNPICSDPQDISQRSAGGLSGQVLLWQIQVVVRMTDAVKAAQYQQFVGASCAVSSFTAGTRVNCNTPSTPANFLVWQGLPSFISSGLSSPSWISTPVLKEFNLQYTNDPMYEMSNTQQATYYLCGG